MNVLPLPKFLFLITNDRCNLKCNHCMYWKHNDLLHPGDIGTWRRCELIQEFAKINPAGSVVICGGESMLDLEAYFAICQTCRDVNLTCLSVINGTMITDLYMAKRMVLEGPSEVSVSFDDWTEQDHDKQRGVEGSFAKAIKAVRLLNCARRSLNTAFMGKRARDVRNFRLYVMGLIHSGNYEFLEAFYDFVLYDLEADKLKLNFLQPSFGLDEDVDTFFADHRKVDPKHLEDLLRFCDKRFDLHLNPEWIAQAGMYFRSLQSDETTRYGWHAGLCTSDHICDSYLRNIMVDLEGVARLCFSPSFQGMQLEKPSDLKVFWESAASLREQMTSCNALCGISHSVRRISATMGSTTCAAQTKRG